MLRRVDAELIKPADYRDYSRRYVRVPDWGMFDCKTQFTTLRMFSIRDGDIVNYNDLLDMYTKEFELGNVIWAHYSTLTVKNFTDFVDEIKRRGLYLFDFWGYVPGMAANLGNGHVTPPEGTVEYMEKVLGDRFLGIDNGEQDGRYIALYANQNCPAAQNYREEFLNFKRYFAQLGEDQGNKLTSLISLTYGHHFLKEGNHMLLGAETAQSLLNSQVYYSFIRGAGKQYGVLWFGNASIWNRWGWKTYAQQETEPHSKRPWYLCGPEAGTSLMLLKRLVYSHYLYNCTIIGFENGWVVGDDVEERMNDRPVAMESDPFTRILSPIGEVQATAVRFVKKNGQPGIMYTPVCVIQDFFSGWTVPRHYYSQRLFQVWGNMPYKQGDFLSHGVFSIIYPGYEDSSYFADERGFLSSTPYGDMADTLFTDVEPDILSRYSTAILAGDVEASAELKSNLEKFVDGGGRLVVTAGNLIKWADGLCGFSISEECIEVAKGSTILTNGIEVEEENSFELHCLEYPVDIEIIAKFGKIPAAVRVKYGKGQLTVLLSPFGIAGEMTADGAGISFDGRTFECDLPNPYPLLKHVQLIIDEILSEERIFKVGDDLAYITCRKNSGEYRLGIYNNTLQQIPFKIESLAGEILNITELPIESPEKGKQGFWPYGHSGKNVGENTPDTIAGGDFRMFDVSIKEFGLAENLTLKQKPIRNIFLSILGNRSIEQEISLRPTFFQHFSGIKLDWNCLRMRDVETLKYEGDWANRQSLQIAVDFSSGLDHFPTLTLADHVRSRYEKSLQSIISVFDKMQVLGAKDAIFSLHRMPEGYPVEKIEQMFINNMKEICASAADRGITIHLQTHPDKWHNTSDEMLEFISSVGAKNLKFAVNFGHLIREADDLRRKKGGGGCVQWIPMSPEDPIRILEKAGEKCSMILMCAPMRDFLGQWYDAHLPFAGTEYESNAKELLAQAGNRILILDADYSSTDEEWADVRIIES